MIHRLLAKIKPSTFTFPGHWPPYMKTKVLLLILLFLFKARDADPSSGGQLASVPGSTHVLSQIHPPFALKRAIARDRMWPTHALAFFHRTPRCLFATAHCASTATATARLGSEGVGVANTAATATARLGPRGSRVASTTAIATARLGARLGARGIRVARGPRGLTTASRGLATATTRNGGSSGPIPALAPCGPHVTIF